jgi:hypothetical protein
MKTQLACTFALTLLAVGCGSDETSSNGEGGGMDSLAGSGTTTAGRSSTGGRTGVGGQANVGGHTNAFAGNAATPGAGQASAIGGSIGEGGAVVQAGSAATSGSMAGGAASTLAGGPAQGGTSVAGATSTRGVGGSVTAGGATTSGGAVAIAGSTGVGGKAATGGSNAVAGAVTTGGSIAAAGSGATGGTCATTYYRDADGDTWGGTQTSCVAATGWVTRTGDCNDANADVFPNQTNSFAVAYTATNGIQSFDYNCDGTETTAGGTQVSTGACLAAGSGNACTGDGYLAVDPARNAADLNQVCGSMRYLVCTRSQQVCISAISTDGTYEAARCR